ncbi:MAG: hypothetical protein ACFCU4_07690 [Puniceicoccaceae bacterium]
MLHLAGLVFRLGRARAGIFFLVIGMLATVFLPQWLAEIRPAPMKEEIEQHLALGVILLVGTLQVFLLVGAAIPEKNAPGFPRILLVRASGGAHLVLGVTLGQTLLLAAFHGCIGLVLWLKAVFAGWTLEEAWLGPLAVGDLLLRAGTLLAMGNLFAVIFRSVAPTMMLLGAALTLGHLAPLLVEGSGWGLLFLGFPDLSIYVDGYVDEGGLLSKLGQTVVYMGGYLVLAALLMRREGI